MLAAFCWSCGSYRATYTPEDPHWKDADTENIPDPGKRGPNLIWETVERTGFEQIDQLLDLDRSLRKVSGNSRQAWNINSFDEVPNSSWYTNRHHLIPMTADEIRRGAIVTGGPDTTGPWQVFRPKVGGATAGFWIEDKNGNQFILKFDPPGHPEMATAAAAMAGRFFYACGYNVPEETITRFRPEDLTIREGVTFKDIEGKKHPFTREKLNEILTLAQYEPDGSVRCLASLALPSIRGPFSFDGTRKNDPNDWCQHEHRRELRALYVLCSMVNHWDIKDQNSMDILADEDGRRFIKHYLLDFGSTFGSAGQCAQSVTAGYCNSFDLRDFGVSFFTLGLKRWQWEFAKDWTFPSIGYFESEIFQPGKWDPIYPIPAFENMTGRDAYWAAKIVMSFTDDDLRAIIDAGELSNPKARNYLFRTLKTRQEKIGRHWFAKVNPLDGFNSEQTDGQFVISFEDFALKYGFNQTAQSEFDMRYDGKTLIEARQIENEQIALTASDIKDAAAAHKPGDKPDANLFEIRIRTKRDGGEYGLPVVLWLWYHADESRLQLVAVEHVD